MPTDHDYAAGLRDGKLEAMEAMQKTQNTRLDKHEGRLSQLERVMWGFFGIIALIEFGPHFKVFLGA